MKKRTEEWKNQTVEFLKLFIEELEWENFKTYKKVEQREALRRIYKWIYENGRDLDVLSKYHEIVDILTKRLIYHAGKRSDVLHGKT